MYMRKRKNEDGRIQLLEGSDQPGLFVEIWDDVTYEEYTKLKDRRKAPMQPGDADWDEWVQGGKAKLHIWHFTKVL